jgi:hypothetical protein
VSLAALGLVQDPVRGVVAVFAVMASGLALLGFGTVLLERQLVSGVTWMILVGFGAYLAYVPFGSFLFDRILAGTRFVGTAVFAINLADATGYTGSVALQIYKDVFASETSRLEFFVPVSYALALLGTVGLVAAGWTYLRAALAARASATPSASPGSGA